LTFVYHSFSEERIAHVTMRRAIYTRERRVTGTYRMATGPTFADAAPMARPLIAAAADRLIWGSDYPHLSFADKVGSVQLFNLLADWAPDEATRRRILVDNPAALFGFSR
jgi:2-pyrone-4,6-dicarboxylate lactonase